MTPCPDFPVAPLFAVLDPSAKGFFLTSGDSLSDLTFPDNPSRKIPENDRFIQYMPSDDMLFWSEEEIQAVGKIVSEGHEALGVSSLTLSEQGLIELSFDPLAEMELRTKDLMESVSGLSRKDLLEAFGDLDELEGIESKSFEAITKQHVTAALQVSMEQYRHQYRADYYDINRVGVSTVSGYNVLFSTGIGGGLILAMDGQFFFEASTKQAASSVKFYADLVLEVAIIIGALIGLRVGGPKIAVGIKKALLDTRFMKALMAILKGLKDGTTSLLNALMLMIELYVKSGLMKTILKAMLTPFALLEALAQLLLLIANPGIALALKWGIIAALGAKLTAKIIEAS